MTESDQGVARPDPRLEQLDRLVGTWEVSGPQIGGTVTYEWMDGGFFMIQHVNLGRDGDSQGIEYIGFEKGWEAMMAGPDYPAPENITSHYFGAGGSHFTYTYEVTDETLTIWGGEKGSPAYYRGDWSDDGNTNSGAWTYPGGGGYESTMRRIA